MSGSDQKIVKKPEDKNQTNKNTLKFIIKRCASYKSLCGLLSGVCLTSFIFLITLPDPTILDDTLYQWALACIVISFLVFFMSLIVFHWIESICYIEKYIDTNLNKNRLQNRTAIMDLFSNVIITGGFTLIIGIFILFSQFSPSGIQYFSIIVSVIISMLCCLFSGYRKNRVNVSEKNN